MQRVVQPLNEDLTIYPSFDTDIDAICEAEIFTGVSNFWYNIVIFFYRVGRALYAGTHSPI